MGLVRREDIDVQSSDWTVLRYEHTSALRALLLVRELAPSTANRHLAALRGVRRECWRLGYVDVEEYRRVVDLEPIGVSRLPPHRRLLSRPDLFAMPSLCSEAA